MSATKSVREITLSVLPYLQMARPYNAPAALTSFLIGYLILSSGLSWITPALALLVILLVHSAFTIQNDMYDIKIDQANGLRDGLAGNKTNIARAKQATLILLLISLAVSYLSGHKYIFLGYMLASWLVAWLYNAPPFQASHRPVMSIVLLGFYYLVLPMVFGLILTGHMTVEVMPLMIGLVLGRMSTSILKDYKDVIGDKKYGKRTFLQAYGYGAVKHTSLLMYLVGSATVLVYLYSHIYGGEFQGLLVPLVLMIVYGIYLRTGLDKGAGRAALTKIFQKSFILENLYCLVVALTLALSWS